MILHILHNLLLSTVLILIAVYLLIFSYKHKKENPYGFNSTIVTVIMLVLIALCILFIENLIPYPLNAAINIWMCIIAAVQIPYFIVIRYKYKERGDKLNIEAETYEESGEIKLKKEYMRKSFHTIIILVLICYYVVAPWANTFIYDIYLFDKELYFFIWKTYDFPLLPETDPTIIIFTWTFMFFICAILLLLIPDIFRIYNRKYSIFSGVYKRVIRMKEFYTVGPQIYLTLGCTFIFLLTIFGFFRPEITLAGMLIAAFGDAAAAIIGRKYGKHKFSTFFQKQEEKSIEGLLAGFIISFLCALFFVGPIIAIFGALIFSVIDYLNPRIADNVLNPIFCTLIMQIPFWLIS